MTTDTATLERKKEGHQDFRDTSAGEKYMYTSFEKAVAMVLAVYLILAMTCGILCVLDVWIGRLTLVHWLGYGAWLPVGNEGRVRLLRLVMFCMSGGWVGGTLSALRSLQLHYVAPVENVGDPARQEKERFHPAYWMRWFWGPFMGAALALVVLALVRAGILVFGGLAPQADTVVTSTENFAFLGLGALAGMSAKDVISKLSDLLKSWLRVEEAEVDEIKIEQVQPKTDEGDLVTAIGYAGETVTFRVVPNIPVFWAIDPPEGYGTIRNGVFRSSEVVPSGASAETAVVITATSKVDNERFASTTLTLKS